MTPTEMLMVSLYGENFRLTVPGDVLNKFQKAFDAENEILERYNGYLNFEYAQFGLDEQDIEEFRKYLKIFKYD